ncbi:MAG: antibiotic biosynthesis monooxygenase [Sphingobacteriaceae bacterium]|nr:antibiotic biosynthesis monooxygenase [Sphingobacteriaceae bacterium]
MIKRIVKLTFREDKVEEFKSIFKENWLFIKNFDGCKHVELLQDQDNPCVFFTYSLWDDEECVENYRKSELFNKVWSSVKILFADKAQAWSVREILT